MLRESNYFIDDFFKDKNNRIQKNNFENYANDVVTEKKDFNVSDDDNKVDSADKEKNEDSHNKKVENQIKEEKKTNKPDVSSSITIDHIQRNWKTFIEKLHIKKPSIASVLDNSVPINLENGKITIQTVSSLEFHLNMIYKNSDLVKNILNDEFSIDMNFAIKKKSESHVDKNQIQDGAGGFSDQDNNQLRDKIVDLFDGEILT
mgnify:CR=1 FL=1